MEQSFIESRNAHKFNSFDPFKGSWQSEFGNWGQKMWQIRLDVACTSFCHFNFAYSYCSFHLTERTRHEGESRIHFCSRRYQNHNIKGDWVASAFLCDGFLFYPLRIGSRSILYYLSSSSSIASFSSIGHGNVFDVFRMHFRNNCWHNLPDFGFELLLCY